MRVLHVNDYPVDPPAGGAEVLIQRTMELLRERGCQVDVFTSTDVRGHRRTLLSYIDSRRARAALHDRIRAFAPDVVHLHNFYHELSPGILAALTSARRAAPLAVVMTAHDAHLACPNSGLNYIDRSGRRRLADAARLRRKRYLLTRRWDHRGRGYSALKLVQHIWNYRMHDRRGSIDRVICPSRFVQHLIDAAGWRTSFIPNPAAIPATTTSSARPPRLQFVFAGRLEPEKGLAEFFAMLPAEFDATILVIGDGADRARCEAFCRERGLADRVQFLGRQPRERTLGLIARSHVLILPSLVAENCPMSLLEALACGTNILTNNFGGMREIVETAGIGLVFDPSDQRSLHQALARIAAAHRDGTLNAFDARAFLAERTEAVYVDRLLALYGEVIAGRVARRGEPRS